MADITYSRRRLMQGTAALGFGLTGTGLAEVSPEGARALAQTPAAAESADGEAAAVAVDAYIYFYSLVTMDVTRRQLTNVEPGKMPGRGPMNTFANFREYPSATMREVVRPNFDTLYSTG